MDDQRKLLRHFLAALAYRTQKALRGAPNDFGSFQAGKGVRTPHQLVRHMTSVLGYARTAFSGGEYRAESLPSFDEQVLHFHEVVQDLARLLKSGTPMIAPMTPERLLQGPFSDAMSHAGQLAMLRRLAGSPVAPEDFSKADVHPERLGPDQAEPASPDVEWREAPADWKPPRK